MIKALIFDFDGLILDTETAWYHAYQEVLQSRFGMEVPFGEFVKCIGANDEPLYSHLRETLGADFDEEFLRGRTKVLHTDYVRKMEAREGVLEYLQEAKRLGLGIALASSSTREWVTTHLSNLNLLSYFDHLVTKDDVERVKPAPDLFLKSLEALEIEAHEAVIFEDSLNGVIAANEAKVPAVVIPNPVTESLPFTNYHLKISSMTEKSLDEIIESLEEVKNTV